MDLGSHQEEHQLLGCADDKTIASSMLGQPPSKFSADDERDPDKDDLETDLRAIWSKAGCDEFGIILEDGIDESKALLLEGEGTTGNTWPFSDDFQCRNYLRPRHTDPGNDYQRTWHRWGHPLRWSKGYGP